MQSVSKTPYQLLPLTNLFSLQTVWLWIGSMISSTLRMLRTLALRFQSWMGAAERFSSPPILASRGPLWWIQRLGMCVCVCICVCMCENWPIISCCPNKPQVPVLDGLGQPSQDWACVHGWEQAQDSPQRTPELAQRPYHRPSHTNPLLGRRKAPCYWELRYQWLQPTPRFDGGCSSSIQHLCLWKPVILVRLEHPGNPLCDERHWSKSEHDQRWSNSTWGSADPKFDRCRHKPVFPDWPPRGASVPPAADGEPMWARPCQRRLRVHVFAKCGEGGGVRLCLPHRHWAEGKWKGMSK